MDIKPKGINDQPFIELNIDEIVLDGFKINDQNSIQESIANELTNLFINNRHQNFFEKDIYLNRINAGNITLKSAEVDEIGIKTANSIYNGIYNSSSSNRNNLKIL